MTIGGAQQVIRQLVENMDGTEIQSEIVCIDNKLGELGQLLQEKGIKIHLLNRQPGFDFSLIKQLYYLVKANCYDVIHCHQYSPYVYGLLASLLTPAKVVFTEHGRFYPDYGTWKRKLINPLFSLFTAKITAISQATKEALVKYENFKPEDIEVIYNGIADNSKLQVDEDALKEKFNIPKHDFIFGTISRLQPIKNQSMMIRAFKQVNDQSPQTHLLVVGDGEIRKELEELVAELNIKGRVTFTGFQKEPYRFHKMIDVFLLSSFSEGTSMTLLEAMSFSKPCVVTAVGGNTELIKDKINGYIAKNDNIDEFYKASQKILCDVLSREKMGTAGRKIYIELFTVENMTEQFVNIYQSIKYLKK